MLKTITISAGSEQTFISAKAVRTQQSNGKIYLDNIIGTVHRFARLAMSEVGGVLKVSVQGSRTLSVKVKSVHYSHTHIVIDGDIS